MITANAVSGPLSVVSGQSAVRNHNRSLASVRHLAVVCGATTADVEKITEMSKKSSTRLFFVLTEFLYNDTEKE